MIQGLGFRLKCTRMLNMVCRTFLHQGFGLHELFQVYIRDTFEHDKIEN